MNVLIFTVLCIGVVAGQKCEDMAPCTPYLKPVCGNNWKQYTNRCELMKASCKQLKKTGNPIGLDYRGRCCKWHCSGLMYDPVCGNNGFTFYNMCELRYHQCVSHKKGMAKDNEVLHFERTGECPMKCSMSCPGRFKPVCGSDAITYHNQCHLKKTSCMYKMLKKDVSLELAYNGACYKKCKKDMKCPVDYEPVCGSDGHTYNNECDLKVAACQHIAMGKKYKKLMKEFDGECEKSCPINCPPNYDAKCGSDGVTYSNKCLLRAAACMSRLANETAPEITEKSDGACASSCNFMCTFVDWEVCGSDGKTYPSPCLLDQLACRMRAANANLPELTLKHHGHCKDGCARFCRKVQYDTCGTDGKTYPNICKLREAACRKKEEMMAAWREEERMGGMKRNKTEKEEEDGKEGWMPLMVQHMGTCGSDGLSLYRIMSKCKKEGLSYDPLCGNDGNNYVNRCQLLVANVLKMKKYGHGIKPMYEGVCRKM